MQQAEKERLQALTVRLPESDYRLLRALSYAIDESLNDIVVMALRRLLDDPDMRPKLEEIIKTAEGMRPRRPIPRNPYGKGRKRPSP